MNILLGVGNTLRSDDGAGIFVAENFAHPNWRAYNCSTAPENFTGIIRRDKPEILLIVDAADMGIYPGEFRVIPKEKIGITGFDTHMMDLSRIIDFLENNAEKIILIGIQPESTEFGDIISENVTNGAKKLIETIKSDILSIPQL